MKRLQAKWKKYWIRVVDSDMFCKITEGMGASMNNKLSIIKRASFQVSSCVKRHGRTIAAGLYYETE